MSVLYGGAEVSSPGQTWSVQVVWKVAGLKEETASISIVLVMLLDQVENIFSIMEVLVFTPLKSELFYELCHKVLDTSDPIYLEDFSY